jgi:hypothetical protein
MVILRFYHPKSSWFQSICLSCFHWSSTYFLIISRSIQTVETKYHLDQKLFWESIFLFQNLLWTIIADFPLSFPMMFATEYFGAILQIMWMWSFQIFHLMISKSNLLASSFSIPQSSFLIPWKRMLFLYFGTITMWNVQSHFVWDWVS